jgi:hypothetical protein
MWAGAWKGRRLEGIWGEPGGGWSGMVGGGERGGGVGGGGTMIEGGGGGEARTASDFPPRRSRGYTNYEVTVLGSVTVTARIFVVNPNVIGENQHSHWRNEYDRACENSRNSENW